MNDRALGTSANPDLAAALRGLPPLPEIPRARYIDPAFYRNEIDYVFRKVWLLAGHTSEFAEEGSYRLLDLPFAPVFLLRGKDGVIRAFLNSCQHRGATVLKDQQGNAKSLTCQYHGWTYDLSGQLIGVPDREDFADLRPEDRSLVSLHCEQWGNFVFINFAADAPPLLDWLAPIARRYTNIADASLRVVSKQSWDIDCNWKIVMDAFRETYHIDMVHRRTLAQMIVGRESKNIMYRDGHFTLLTPYSTNVDWKGVEQQSTLARLPGIGGQEYIDNVVLPGVFPNTLISIQLSGFPVLQVWPLSPDRSRIDFAWYGMDWGGGPMPEEWHAVTAAYDVVVREDLSNLASIQKSLEADPDKRIPLAQQEVMVYQLHAEIDRLIGEENVAPELRVPDILGDHLVA